MSILAWIVLGGLAGWIATLIMGRDASYGVVGNVVLGVIGAFVGGLVFSMFGEAGVTGFNLVSLIVAVVGAVAVLWIAQMLRTTAP